MDEAMRYYREASAGLENDFFDQFMVGIGKIEDNPECCHFDTHNGLRRYNLKQFPYHFLYDQKQDHIRVWVLRYDGRKPSFGLRRFS